MSEQTAGEGGIDVVGDYGTAIIGRGGVALAGYHGAATAGDRGTAITGGYGIAIAGDHGIAIAGYCGTATAGGYGTAIIAGRWGIATAGYKGIAVAEKGGELRIRWHDGKRYRTAVAYVGEDGIEANTKYCIEGDGKFVKVIERQTRVDGGWCKKERLSYFSSFGQRLIGLWRNLKR